MDPNQVQQGVPEIQQPQQLPNQPISRGFTWSRVFLLLVGVLFVVGVGIGGYFLGIKNKQPSTSAVTPSQIPTSAPIVFVDFTDNAKVFTLKIPKNYGANDLFSNVTDSCTLFSDKSIVNPGITASEAAILKKEGTFIDVCYTSNTFPDAVPSKLITPEDTFTIVSLTPFSTNDYSGFKAHVSAENKDIQDIAILKSPYGGYATISRQTNGQEVFNTIISSFHFIAQTTVRYSTADQTVVRKLFSDQYNKDITVTFGYPSSNQNSVGGMVYLPQGQKCFNADRSANGWNVSYVSTQILDSKCYNFSPPTSATP